MIMLKMAIHRVWWLLAAICTCAEAANAAVRAAQSSQPNLVFLLTDDQDVTAHSLDYMPKLNRLLRQEGTEFLNYFVPTGLCCPSRIASTI